MNSTHLLATNSMLTHGMRTLVLVAMACLGIAWSPRTAIAASTQRVVSFKVDGQRVVGTLASPQGVKAPPVVLLLHGFTGSRDELKTPSVQEGIFARAAAAWAAKGFASLRIDFRGGGDSDGKFEDTTLSGQIKDAMAAVDFLQSEKTVDASRLSLVGWSMGGAVASAVAGRSTHPIRGVALWTPLTNPPMSVSSFLGADYMAAGLNSGDTVVTTKSPWGSEIALRAGFFEDLFKIDPVAELARYRGPVFVAAGSNDQVIKPQPAMSQILLTYRQGRGELWVRSMDHSFNAFQTSATVDELIAATFTFIEKNDKEPDRRRACRSGRTF